jgi:hypothetical protein
LGIYSQSPNNLFPWRNYSIFRRPQKFTIVHNHRLAQATTIQVYRKTRSELRITSKDLAFSANYQSYYQKYNQLHILRGHLQFLPDKVSTMSTMKHGKTSRNETQDVNDINN